jgi:hypothetical protein
MIRISEIKLPLEAVPFEQRREADAPAESAADLKPPAHPLSALQFMVAQKLGLQQSQIKHVEVFKRSFDARKAQLQVSYIVDVKLAEGVEATQLLQQHANDSHVQVTPDMAWQSPVMPQGDWAAETERPVVVGFGPCGIFAALILAQIGLKPIVLERGTTVRQRTKDTWGLWRKKQLNAESNVQFGEGGAGTFSDGKLYSQIKDPRFLGRKVMQELVQAGAPEEILYAAHPHIGTFKLVKVVEQLREKIIALGGEVRFQQRVIDLESDTGPDGLPCLKSLMVWDAKQQIRYQLSAKNVVMALGHSARDTFAMLHHHRVPMQAKPFSIGFRIEHPQGLIDRARWGRHAGHALLGAADYKLVHHARNGRSVYSFCMCPGGTVVAATSEIGRVVTNGMSQYSRNERNANAGLVVGIDPTDYPQDPGRLEAAFALPSDQAWAASWTVRHIDSDDRRGIHPLSGVVLQRELESRAYELGGFGYEAPAQLVGDFLKSQASTGLGTVEPSYKPGVTPTDLNKALPAYATDAMREALPVFGKKIKGFDLADAVLTGVETRTSSPLRIERDAIYQSPGMRGLYPAGEGAGFAGGILSAAVDGIKVAEALALAVVKSN